LLLSIKTFISVLIVVVRFQCVQVAVLVELAVLLFSCQPVVVLLESPLVFLSVWYEVSLLRLQVVEINFILILIVSENKLTILSA